MVKTASAATAERAARRRCRVDLAGLMAVYDASYMALARLVPSLLAPEAAREAAARFRIGGGPGGVTVAVVESFRYTTVLRLEQHPPPIGRLPGLSMVVRACHDARTAEVVSCQGHRGLRPRYRLPNPGMYQPDEKIQVNRLLGEWLILCLKAGRRVAAPGLLLDG